MQSQKACYEMDGTHYNNIATTQQNTITQTKAYFIGS
jgi:hypothetical protein